MNRVKLNCYVGPVYEYQRNMYQVDYVLVPFEATEFFVPRGSEFDQLNSKRPVRGQKRIKGHVNERCVLYPSNDLLGRRECVELLPVLTDTERDFLRDRMHITMADDASGELLGMYGLHQVLEAVRQDEDSPLYRETDRAALAGVREIIEAGIKQGKRYGMPMRVTLVQSS